jgi:CRP-like cAMP-binding protein
MLRDMKHPLKSHRLTTSKSTLLRQVPALAGCTEREITELATLVDDVEVPEGHVLTEEGRQGREAFLVVEGWAAVMIGDEPIAAIGPGELVGEMAMLDHKPRSATVVAKTPMKLLIIGPRAFGMFANQPAIARSIRQALVSRLRHTDAAVSNHDEAPR